MPETFLYKVIADRDGIFEVYDALHEQGLAPSEPCRRGGFGCFEYALTVRGTFDDLAERVNNASFSECEIWPVTPV